MDKLDGRENIVIVGLGPAGGRVAHLLLNSGLDLSKYNVVVINPRPFNIIYLATARLIVANTDNLDERAFIPVEQVLRDKGTFIQGRVAHIEPSKDQSGGQVTLDNGEHVPYRVLVLATGAIWDEPLSFPDSKADITQHINKWRDSIKMSESVVLVGGGAVGCELAGEIKDIWPDKKVTIVHGGRLPFSDVYPDKFRKAQEAGLRARNVDFLFNEYIDEIPAPGGSSVKTRSGKVIEADLVISARGQRFNTGFISESLGSSLVNKRGLVKIDPTFQVSGHKDIFAVGDIIDWDEQKQHAKATKHANLAAANIQAHLKGAPMKPYGGQPEMMLVTNGKNGGVTYMGILWGLVFGDCFSRMVKSRDLFIAKLRSQLGADPM